ncbi:MAG TPA: CDP-alcohol phosphatidyltransferase family protein [Terriglobales bacterium]|nr:CDP-alcohol phosphatidyltransferase family protein [Terriglobales bacterium]
MATRPTSQLVSRRPLRSRQTKWANTIARTLARWGVSPNYISLASIGFSLIGTAALVAFTVCHTTATRAALLVVTAACIQLRLLCNLIDGMVAIEGGMKSNSGEIYNDLPDRISDSLIFAAAGYAVPWKIGPELGWTAALLAVFTAYVRVLGGSTGTQHYFLGPMAKQQRMALMTAALLASVIEIYVNWHGWLLGGGLVVVIIGSVITAMRRVARIVHDLESR